MSRTATTTELAEMLSRTLGEDKARAVVDEAVVSLGLDGETFDRPTTLRVLETIADSDGILSITARFVRSRLLMSWPAGA